MKNKKIKNAGKGNIIEKTKRKIRTKWVSKLRNTGLYKYCYRSYWHYLFNKSDKRTQTENAEPDCVNIRHENISCEYPGYENLYFAARPNPGAGIGHQMANWIAGYWFAKQFHLKFAYIPFSNEKWEQFLGFYQGEQTVRELKQKGYKVVRIQKFDEDSEIECNRIKKIIASYSGKKIIFLAEQDQFYHDQYGVMDALQKKFYSAPARKKEELIYQKGSYNIAVHVRRGDIMQNLDKNNSNISIRYQGNEYFVNALNTAIEHIKGSGIAEGKEIHIYLFSQGEEKDYQEFSTFDNLHFCLDMGAQDSFLHMVYADALITSKSSFSYKPALLNKGIKFSPANFWHGYPETEDWVLLNEEGNLA